MAEPKFQNILLSDRTKLPPQQSIQKLIDYALMQDNRTRSRKFNNVKATWLASVVVFGFPVYYLIKGTLFGCWTELHPDTKLNFSFATVGRPVRLLYRPEIYYRDKQEFLYTIEKENIQREKAGEKPLTNSPIVLWH